MCEAAEQPGGADGVEGRKPIYQNRVPTTTKHHHSKHHHLLHIQLYLLQVALHLPAICLLLSAFLPPPSHLTCSISPLSLTSMVQLGGGVKCGKCNKVS